MQRNISNMSKNTPSEKFIDIEKIFAEKNASLAKLLPGFVFSYIKRIIHQEEINDFLKTNGHLKAKEFIEKVIEYFRISLDIVGAENIKPEGRFVFAANHPLGGLEGIALTNILAEKYGDIRVPVNDILTKIENFKPYFSPINKHGSSSKEAIKLFDANYASDIQMLMFPSGMVSRKINGVITDLEWKKTFITKSIQHKRDIVPIFVGGHNSKFFYGLGRLRSFLGIKANLEMFFLPNELFKQKDQTIKLIFGEPVPYTFFDKRMNYIKWALKMQEYIYELAKGYDNNFQQYVEDTHKS